MAGGKNKPKGPSSSARAAAFFNKNAGSDTSPGCAYGYVMVYVTVAAYTWRTISHA